MSAWITLLLRHTSAGARSDAAAPPSSLSLWLPGAVTAHRRQPAPGAVLRVRDRRPARPRNVTLPAGGTAGQGPRQRSVSTSAANPTGNPAGERLGPM